jgi:hypothetical protein
MDAKPGRAHPLPTRSCGNRARRVRVVRGHIQPTPWLHLDFRACRAAPHRSARGVEASVAVAPLHNRRDDAHGHQPAQFQDAFPDLPELANELSTIVEAADVITTRAPA